MTPLLSTPNTHTLTYLHTSPACTLVLFQLGRGERPTDADAEAKQQHDQLLSNMLGWILTLLPTFRPRHVSVVMHALSKLSLWNPEVGAREGLNPVSWACGTQRWVPGRV